MSFFFFFGSTNLVLLLVFNNQHAWWSGVGCRREEQTMWSVAMILLLSASGLLYIENYSILRPIVSWDCYTTTVAGGTLVVACVVRSHVQASTLILIPPHVPIYLYKAIVISWLLPKRYLPGRLAQTVNHRYVETPRQCWNLCRQRLIQSDRVGLSLPLW